MSKKNFFQKTFKKFIHHGSLWIASMMFNDGKEM
jgi:hypothetical protein